MTSIYKFTVPFFKKTLSKVTLYGAKYTYRKCEINIKEMSIEH